jgi:hypothetical protein
MNLPRQYKEKYLKEIKDLNCDIEVDYLQYVRGNNRKPFGVVIVDNNKCGWSICHRNDKWDRITGIYKAVKKLNGQNKTIDQVIKEINQVINNTKKMNDYVGRKIVLKYVLQSIQYKIKKDEVVEMIVQGIPREEICDRTGLDTPQFYKVVKMMNRRK